MPRKSQADTAQTRLSILEAGLLVFARDGYSNTTLEDVAVAAGVTRGAIYWHFAGKSNLIKEIFLEYALPLENFTRDKSLDETKSNLRKAIKLSLTRLKYRQLMQIVIYKNELNEPIASLILDLRQKIYDQLIKLIIHPMRKNKNTTEHLTLVAEWLNATLYGILSQDLIAPRSEKNTNALINLTFNHLESLLANRSDAVKSHRGD